MHGMHMTVHLINSSTLYLCRESMYDVIRDKITSFPVCRSFVLSSAKCAWPCTLSTSALKAVVHHTCAESGRSSISLHTEGEYSGVSHTGMSGQAHNLRHK